MIKKFIFLMLIALPSFAGTHLQQGDSASLASVTVAGSSTFNGPVVGAGGVGNLGQVLASQGAGQPPVFIDPIVSQATASNLNASCYINGSSNTVQVAGFVPLQVSTIAVNNVGAQLVDISTFANVAASQTDQVMVGLIAATTICITELDMVTGGTATNVTINSKPSGSGTAISPLYANAANGGIALSWDPLCLFRSNSGEGISITTSAGSSTGIHFKYLKI